MRTRPTRFYSNKQEKAVAKQVDGKQQSNSGATPFYKGDVTTDEFLIECKTTISTKASFSIKKEWLEKNRQEALEMRKQCNALCFDYGDGVRYYVIDERLFKRLVRYVEEDN